ncbi:MAG: ATP-binding cassette domain-containing protein, partial [Clostridia bacterium]|nr:ATP-binding cassette domain-containing protein [Clostridia bacterium]
MSEVFFNMEGINKFYQMGDERMHILKDVCLSLEKGEYLSVLGPSGSGKSTLMNIIGCLDTPTSG